MFRRIVAAVVPALAVAASILGLPGCPEAPPADPRLRGQVKLTLLHTADMHSRLLPYQMLISQSDAALGLGAAGSIATVGGAARVAYVLDRERARADRVLHIDGGDCFQGAPIFNFFSGEAEVRAMSLMGTDAQVIANHEFDQGALNVRIQDQKWATFPVLAANYKLEDGAVLGQPGLDTVLRPFTIINTRGLKVGVIGMANLSSLTSLFERPSRLGVTPLDTIDTAQAYTDLLRPLVDLVVVVSHLGLSADEAMIAGTTGIDVVLGGHNHIVLQPPKEVSDCALTDDEGRHYIALRDADGRPSRRYCQPRPAILAHSGAFAKYVGRLDVVASNDPADLPPRCASGSSGRCYDPLDGFEIIGHSYQLFPITEDVPEDRALTELLEPYVNQMDQLVDLDLVVGYAPDGSRRFGTSGGDSPLGNMIATAMRQRLGVQTDFSLTNTTGIRTDMVPGPVTIEEAFNIFPFDNSISKMQLSGDEVLQMFDFVARRSAGRGCVSQVQIAGARVVLNCAGCARANGEPCAEHVYIGTTSHPCSSDADCANQRNACDLGARDASGQGRCLAEISPTASYELATSNYLAGGGSGFTMLKRNTTQFDTRIQQRDALVDWIRAGKPCGWSAETKTPDGLTACSTDADCARVGTGYACACAQNASEDASGACRSGKSCEGGGRCVLAACRQDVADFHRRRCADPRSAKNLAACTTRAPACELGGEQCKYLACVGRDVGNFSDDRILTVGQ